MMVGYISPHHPFDPPAPYSTMYDPNSCICYLAIPISRPLRFQFRQLSDPLIKIPLIVKYPGQQAAGQTDSFLSENIDVAPTVLELCGQPIPPTMQGTLAAWKRPQTVCFSEAQFGSQTNSKIGYMLRSDSYKLLVYGNMQDCVFMT